MSGEAIVQAVREEAAQVAATVAETVAENHDEEEDGTEWLEERLRAQENLTQQLLTESRESRSQMVEIMGRLMSLMESQSRALAERQTPAIVEVVTDTSNLPASEEVAAVAATLPENAEGQEEAQTQLENRPHRRRRI